MRFVYLMLIDLKLFMSMRICLPGIDRKDCIVVLSCFILCLCCDGTTT